MNAKFFKVVSVVVLLALLMTGCGSYHNGIKSCGYGGFLGIGKTWVYQGQLHPENPAFICNGTDFVAVTDDETAPEQPLVDPAPQPVSCDTPSIKAGLTAADIEFGEYLDTNLGERMTFTSRRPLVPDKKWNDPLTPEELKTVEQTWLFATICVPEGMSGTIFAGGYEQGINRYENGVLMTLGAGVYEFKIRNGEIVLWYPGQEEFAKNDLDRIVAQIRTGNFDIKSPLAFFAATTDLMAKIPNDLIKARNVQIAAFPKAN